MKRLIDTQEIITEARLIAGYLRDAIFHKSIFVIRHEHLVINAVLTNIFEKSARDHSSDRSLEFQIEQNKQFQNELPEFTPNTMFEVAVATNRNLIKFDSQLISLEESGKLKLTVPSQSVIVTSRQSYRFIAGELSPKTCTVVIESRGLKQQFATLEISDVSDDGIGGTLSVSKSLDLLDGPRVRGRLLQKTGALVIDGNISWAQPIHGSDGKSFRVGIKNYTAQLTEQSQSDIKQDVERRKRPRLRAELIVEVISPLFPKSESVLQLEDLSLQGLRARFLNLADRALFRPNLELFMENPRLRLQVSQLGKKNITFKILRSAIEEHIRLFNLQSFLSEPDLASRTPLAGDITQIYATSGALTTDLVRTLSKNRDHILNSTATNDDTYPWFLRWFQQSETGRLKAAILTAPYSDHVWYLGGLAGHLDSNLKMSSDFVKRYFLALNNFLNSLGSREYLFFNWFETNTWWNEWEKNLGEVKESADFFRIGGDIIYLKDRNQLNPDNHKVSTWERVGQGSVAKTEELLSEMKSQSMRRLFTAFGLNPFTFGAPAVGELLRRSGHHFSREFFRMEINGASILAMTSTFPDYTFINGIINYPFIYSSRQLTAEEMEMLTENLSSLCVEIGIELPAFFYTAEGKKSEIRETTNLTLKAIKWTFGPPEILENWRDE